MDTEGEVFCFYDYLPINTMPPHVKMSIKHDMRELFLKQTILSLELILYIYMTTSD
jgi:hypothetical protein